MPIPIGVPMAVGLGGALLGGGENEKETPPLEAMTPPPAPAAQQQPSGWTLSCLLAKTEDVKSIMAQSMSPWNVDQTRMDLLKKICVQNGFARQGEMKDLEHRLKAGMHWTEAQLQTTLKNLYLQQVKDGAVQRMRLGVAAFTTATSTAAEPVLQVVPGFQKPPPPDPFNGQKELLLKRLSVRYGFSDTGNIKKLSYQLQRNLGWEDEQLQAKLMLEYHMQQQNTWLPSPLQKKTPVHGERAAEKAEEKAKEQKDAATLKESKQTKEEDEEKEDPEQDSNWEYVKSSPSNRSADSESGEHLEQKKSDSDELSATEPCSLRHRDLQRTLSAASALSDAASDSSYEVIDS